LDLPEKVDMIISEPMGIMLVNERMLESYLHARRWWAFTAAGLANGRYS